MVDLNQHKKFNFYEIATLERAKKDKLYSDCIKIQLSATHGQTFVIKEPQTVEDKYGVITPADWIDVYYFNEILKKDLPEFLAHHQNGININPKIFEELTLDLHTQQEAQLWVVSVMRKFDEWEEQEQKILDGYLQLQDYYLNTMFVGL